MRPSFIPHIHTHSHQKAKPHNVSSVLVKGPSPTHLFLFAKHTNRSGRGMYGGWDQDDSQAWRTVENKQPLECALPCPTIPASFFAHPTGCWVFFLEKLESTGRQPSHLGAPASVGGQTSNICPLWFRFALWKSYSIQQGCLLQIQKMGLNLPLRRWGGTPERSEFI